MVAQAHLQVEALHQEAAQVEVLLQAQAVQLHQLFQVRVLL